MLLLDNWGSFIECLRGQMIHKVYSEYLLNAGMAGRYIRWQLVGAVLALTIERGNFKLHSPLRWLRWLSWVSCPTGNHQGATF